MLSEINDGKNYTDIEWSPYNRGLILGYNTEDELNVLDFSSASSKNEATDSSYAPKWLSRPLGARFGFGGKLVTFSSKPNENMKVYQTQSIPEVCNQIKQLEESRSKLPLTEIIDDFISKSSKNEIEKMEWTTIRSLSTKNFDSLFALLDIDKDAVFTEAERFSGKKKQKPNKGDSSSKVPKEGLANLDANQANEFFATLAETSDKRKEEEEKKSEANLGPVVTQETVSRNSNWNEGPEGIIKRNLLIGNVEGAAECALKCGRTTEALLLALSAPNDKVFEQIKEEYFANNKDSFVSTIIKSIVDDDIEDLVMDLAQSNWKEAIAYTLSYTPKSGIKGLVEKIAEHLLHKRRDVNSAIICYMISTNIQKLAELWKMRADTIIKKNPQHKYAILCNFAEKITFYRLATGITDNSPNCDDLISEFAEYLSNEGLFEISLRYLSLNGCRSSESARVTEKVYYHNERLFGNEFERPKYNHKSHQLPRINPKSNQQRGPAPQQNSGRKPAGNRGANPFANEIKPAFNQPPVSNPMTQPPPNNNPVPPPRNTNTKNKNANFGYSTTDPLLMSENEESKATPQKPKQQRRNNSTSGQNPNTNIFDPSKAGNVPPPKPHQRHPDFATMQAPPNYDQASTRSSISAADQSPFSTAQGFGGAPHESEPVIAATKVKPPTAQMKPKMNRPIQRYAPHPRMSGGESSNASPAQTPMNPPMNTPMGQPQNMPPPIRPGAGAPPPNRGRGAPPMRGGRGMAPPGRGGAPPASMRGGMGSPAPAPFPSGPAPGNQPAGGMPAPMQPMTASAPPPPMISRRPKPSAQ